MNVLFVLENYLPHVGGVEIVFKNLSEGLAKLGHDASIVTHRLKGTKKFEKINGVNVYRVNCFHSRYWFTFLSIPKVMKLASKADIIHTTSFNGAFPAWLVSKIKKRKCIITVHEVWIGKWKKLAEMNFINAFIHDILERLIYILNFDKYACVSKSTQNDILKIGIAKSKSKIVYNGVDYNHWNPAKYNGDKIRKKLGLKNEFVYLFTGRPGVSKGLEYLIKAVPKISDNKNIPNSKLLAVVSKDRAYRKGYSLILKLIKKLGIEDKVIIRDPVPYNELPAYVKAADCVVVPSLTEGFGFTAAEACAMKKPVVASDTTSLPEVVSGKYILVKPGDPEELAKGIIAASNGRLKTKKLILFKKEENIYNYIRLYKELLAGKKDKNQKR